MKPLPIHVSILIGHSLAQLYDHFAERRAVDLRTSVTLDFTLGGVTHILLLSSLISPKESLDILGPQFPHSYMSWVSQREIQCLLKKK